MKNIIKPRPNIDENLIKPFRDMEDVMSLSAIISDCMDRDSTMRPYMKPKAADKVIIGPAVTVKLTAGDIVDCLVVFDEVKPGDVIVIDAFGEENTSIWGGLMSGLAKNEGVVGAVIDGSCRDTDEAKFLDFPVTAKVSGPRAAHTATSGRKEPIEINVPIVCGGIIVNPGDLVVADEIGVSVVPYDQLERVAMEARKLADAEEASRKEILKGATYKDLLEKFGRI